MGICSQRSCTGEDPAEATEIIRSLELREERLLVLGLFSLENRLRDLINAYIRGGLQEGDAGFFSAKRMRSSGYKLEPKSFT